MNSELREKILNTISKNSRYSAKELAAMLGSDETAVTNELKQMEQENVICGYPTLINWDKTDCEKVTALIEVKVTPQRDMGFKRLLRGFISLTRSRVSILCQVVLTLLLRFPVRV